MEFVDPYREMAWLFAQLIRHEYTALMHRYVIFVIYYTLLKDETLNWDEMFSNEIAHQLIIYRKTRRFYMSSYLIFALVCNITFGIY
jgi:hypothetical protein